MNIPVFNADKSSKFELKKRKIRLTHYQSGKKGWRTIFVGDEIIDKTDVRYLVYLGECEADGHMFASHETGNIYIYKGYFIDS